mmetsp:Transcript_45209/g.114465  ORF Transcript_45209/g.114465 Transcript_45209/m.114465 type:complete len:330 (-) Transcript_45209:55-1044(-)
MQVAVGLWRETRPHLAAGGLQVLGQLLRGVADRHHLPVAEVDGRVDVLVVLRLGEEGVGVRGDLRLRLRSLGSLHGGRLLLLGRLGLGLLLARLLVLRGLGPQQRLHLPGHLRLHRFHRRPLHVLARLAQQDVGVVVVPVLLQLRLHRLHLRRHSRRDLLRRHHHAHAAGQVKVGHAQVTVAEGLQEVVRPGQLVRARNLLGGDVAQQEAAVPDGFHRERARHLVHKIAHRLVAAALQARLLDQLHEQRLELLVLQYGLGGAFVQVDCAKGGESGFIVGHLGLQHFPLGRMHQQDRQRGGRRCEAKAEHTPQLQSSAAAPVARTPAAVL